MDVTVGSFYAGAWASNVDFGDDTDAEFDVYGGYRTEVSGFVVDVGVVGYLYVSAPTGRTMTTSSSRRPRRALSGR